MQSDGEVLMDAPRIEVVYYGHGRLIDVISNQTLPCFPGKCSELACIDLDD